MAEVKVNGDDSPRSEASSSNSSDAVSSAVTSSSGHGKSVISISGSNVTITSTDKIGGTKKTAQVTTTPLRSNQDPAFTGMGHVSEKIRDTQFVTALSQKIQASSGPLRVSVPSAGLAARSAPASINTSSRASASHSRSSSSGSSSLCGEDITSKLSQMLHLQQQQQQQQQQMNPRRSQAVQGDEGQHECTDSEGRAASVTCPASSSSLMVNGVPSPNSSSQRDSGASSPDIPLPPPVSTVVRSISQQEMSRRVPDASYMPRAKSYSIQSSVPSGNGNAPHNKHDLMAALTAVVTSGSATSGLRKTRGPGKGGGVTEVYSSKKTSASSSQKEMN